MWKRAMPKVHDEMMKVEDLSSSSERSDPNEASLTLDSRDALLPVSVIVAILALCYLAQPVMIVLCVSVLTAFILAPITDVLEKLRLPRSVAAFLSVLTAMVVLYVITYFFSGRAINFLDDLPRYASKFRQTLWRVQQQAQMLQKSGESMLPKTKEEERALRVIPQRNWYDILTRNAGSVTGFVFLVSFIPFLVYFMLTWRDHLLIASVQLFKAENRVRAYRTLHLMSAMMRSFIAGSVLVGVLVGAVSTVVFAMLGLPYFYFLGFLSGFLSLIPYLGVVLAVVPPLLAGVGLGAKEIALMIAAVVVLHVVALNLLYPKLLGSRLHLNPLAVTVALLFWGWLWGGIGLILAVPITGLLRIVFDRIESLKPYGAWMGDRALSEFSLAGEQSQEK